MVPIPRHLHDAVETPEQRAWLAALPDAIERLCRTWSLTLQAPITENATCSWVAPCRDADGDAAVLKLGMPHMEGRSEIDGLRFWAGDPTVRVLAFDAEANALLLERCVPGTPLSAEPPEVQDRVLAELLPRLWRAPPADGPFRALTEMIAGWNAEVAERANAFPDPGLARAGAAIRAELAASAPASVTLGTDVHAGNVLRAERRPWLVIDPKPFVGDPAFDATQHLLNHVPRLTADLMGRFADRVHVPGDRLRRWVFARLASELEGRFQDVARHLDLGA